VSGDDGYGRVMRTVLIGLAVAVALWLVAIAVLVLLGRRSAARELATLIPNVVALVRGLLKDDRVSRGSKALLVFAVVWLVSPIDLVPEFIPVAGPLDDAIVAALVLRFVLRRTDRAVVEAYWRGDPRTLDRLAGRPR
jgi:uncharacterized membrane protein YkvA (DUF1232 family)